MKHHQNASLSIAVAVLLSACGGGGDSGGGEGPPLLISASAGPAVMVDANGGLTIDGSASTTRYPLSSLSWNIQAADPSAAAVVLSNEGCATAVKKDTPGVNSGGQAYTASNWSCKLGVKVGAPRTSQDYTVVLTAKDSNGGVTSSSTTLTVKAAPVASTTPVTVTAGDLQEVTAGTAVALNCLATGGTTASGNYSWQWAQVSTPDVPLALANPASQATSFLAPAVATPTTVSLECRATDDAAVTGKATKVVRLMPSAPQAQPVLIASAGTAQVATPTSRVTLDAAGTKWFDAQGNPTNGSFINYAWTQTAGPAVMLTNPNSASASFEVPSGVASRTTFEFEVTASSVLASSGTPTSSTAKVSVVTDPAASLNLSLLTPAIAVGAGESVALWGLTSATGNATVYYSWTQVAGPTVQLGGGSTAGAGFIVPLDALFGTTYVFRVSAGYQPISSSYPGVRSEDLVVTVVR